MVQHLPAQGPGLHPWGEAGGGERENGVNVCPQVLCDSTCSLLGPGETDSAGLSIYGPSFSSSIHVSNIKATGKTER